MRRLLSGALVAAGVATGFLVAATPASAAGTGYCDFTEYCMYESANATAGIVAVAGNIPDYDPWVFVFQRTANSTGIGLNDRVSSYRNNGENVGATVIHSYRHSQHREELWSAPIGPLQNVPLWANDQASSHNWQRS